MRFARLLTPALPAALLLLTACETVEQTRTVTVPLDRARPVHVVNRNGPVHVVQRPGTHAIVVRATVQACDTGRLDDVHVAVIDQGDGLRICTDWPSHGSAACDGATLRVEIPAAAGVEVDNRNGGVQVEGFAGGVTVDTTNGAVSVSHHHGPVQVQTTNGGVQVLGGEAVDVATTNGAVRVVDPAGPVWASTRNGSMGLWLGPDRDPDANFDLRTSNGPLRVTLGGFAGVVLGGTTNGAITVPQGPDVAPDVRGDDFTLRVGAGAAQGLVQTTNGPVIIER